MDINIIANKISKYYKNDFYIEEYTKNESICIRMGLVELYIYKIFDEYEDLCDMHFYYEWRNGKREFDFTLNSYYNYNDNSDINRDVNDFRYLVDNINDWFI